MAGLWLLTLLYFQRRQPGKSPAGKSRDDIPEKESAILAELKKACNNNNARAVRNLLGTWLRSFGPASAQGSVMGFAVSSGRDDLREAIYGFDAAAFRSEGTDDWNGSEFWKIFSAWLDSRNRPKREKENVPDLYARAR